MELAATADAGFGEKDRSSLMQWNGYWDREWEIWAGTVGLRIPKLRTGSYSLSVAATIHPKGVVTQLCLPRIHILNPCG